jgi:adenosine deaminase
MPTPKNTASSSSSHSNLDAKIKQDLVKWLIMIVSETNGIALKDTLNLLISSALNDENHKALDLVKEFRGLLEMFVTNKVTINTLLAHPVSECIFEMFRNFPVKFHEEHIHLTGSLTAEFLYPRLKKLLEGPHKEIYEQKIREVYGEQAIPIRSVSDVDKLIRLQETEGFVTYLKILYLPKLVFISREAHAEASYHMAEELYHKYNVGSVRLKFTLDRATSSSSEQIPGIDDVTQEDVVLGLYEGFKKFQDKHPDFNFILSPSFRKEPNFFDSNRFESRKQHFMEQINRLIEMLDKYPFLQKHLTDTDTVGDERELYRKEHFYEMQAGFRKLQYRGLKIRSHHGETWHTLKKGIQAVDNAMNIWHIDTLEHGISLGINPNVYFHQLYQAVAQKNRTGTPISPKDPNYRELVELDWGNYKPVLDKLLAGTVLNDEENTDFLKAKFHTAREVEHYQHDVLNRMIQKEISLISLPSSNNKLTGKFDDYKDHPFSWWEKKNVQLGVGTDNYVTLNTNFIQELMILLYTDPDNLKITKLLMVASKESRRPYISHLLWKMRKKMISLP